MKLMEYEIICFRTEDEYPNGYNLHRRGDLCICGQQLHMAVSNVTVDCLFKT